MYIAILFCQKSNKARVSEMTYKVYNTTKKTDAGIFLYLCHLCGEREHINIAIYMTQNEYMQYFALPRPFQMAMIGEGVGVDRTHTCDDVTIFLHGNHCLLVNTMMQVSKYASLVLSHSLSPFLHLPGRFGVK